MKLHIPTSLRAALLACFSIVAPFAQTVTTGAFVGGVVTCTLLASQAQAADVSITESGTWGTGGTTTTTSADTLTVGNGTDTLDIVVTLVSNVEAASVDVTYGTTLSLITGLDDDDDTTNYGLTTTVTVEDGATLRMGSNSLNVLEYVVAPDLTVNVEDGGTFVINYGNQPNTSSGARPAYITIGNLNFSGTSYLTWYQYAYIIDTKMNVTGTLNLTFYDGCRFESGYLTGDGTINLTGSGWSGFYFTGVDATGFTGVINYNGSTFFGLGDLSLLGYSELILGGSTAPTWNVTSGVTSELGNVTLNGGILAQNNGSDVLTIDTLNVTSSGGTLAVGDTAAVDITIDELTGEGDLSITVGSTVQTRAIDITSIVDYTGTVTSGILSDTEGASGGTVTISSITVSDGVSTVLTGYYQSSNLSVSQSGTGSVSIAYLTMVADADGGTSTLSMNDSGVTISVLLVSTELNLIYDGTDSYTTLSKAAVTEGGSIVLDSANLTGLSSIGTDGYYDLGISNDQLSSAAFDLTGVEGYSLDNTTYDTWVLVLGDGSVVDPDAMEPVGTVTFTDASITWGSLGDFISDEESVITFGDGTADTVITLVASETATAESVTVASGTSLTIQGSGALTTTLTVEAGGSLTMGGTQSSLDVVLAASETVSGDDGDVVSIASMYLSAETQLGSLTMNDGSFLNVYGLDKLVSTEITASGTVTLQRDTSSSGTTDSGLDSTLTIAGTGTFQLVNNTSAWSYVSFNATVTHTGTLEIIDTSNAGAVYLNNLASFTFSEVLVSGGYLIFGSASSLDLSGTNFTMDGSTYTDNHSGLSGTVTDTTMGSLTVTTGTTNTYNVVQASTYAYASLTSADLTDDTTDDLASLALNVSNASGNFTTGTIEDFNGTITITISADGGVVSTAGLSAGEGISTIITGGVLDYTGDTLCLYMAGSMTIDTLNLTSALTLTFEALADGITTFADITSITGDQTITVDLTALGELEFGDTINLGLSTDAIDESLISYDTNQCSLSDVNGYWTLTVDAGGTVLTWGNGLTDLSSEEVTADVTIYFSGEGESTVGVTTEVAAKSLVVNAGSYTFDGTGSMTAESLDISDSATLVLSANTTVTDETTVGASASLSVSEGFTLETGSLTVNGAFTNAGTTTVTGAMTQGASATITNTGTLNVGNGTVLTNVSGGSLNVLDSASVTIDSITDGTSVSVGSGATLNVSSNTTLADYNSAGSIDVGSNSLTLTGEVTSGGNITAGALSVQAEGATLGNVTADSITSTSVITMGEVTANSITLTAIAKNDDGTSLLTVDSLNSEGSLTIDLTNIIEETSYFGDYASETGLSYTLIDGSGDSLIASGFSVDKIAIDGDTQTIINEYAITYGLTTELVVEDGDLVLNFVALEDGELSLNDGYYLDGSTVVNIYQDGSTTVLDDYSVLDNATQVTVDADKTLSLDGTGEGGTATLNNLTGSNTLTLEGSSAEADTFVIANNTSSALAGALVVNDAAVSVENDGTNAISINSVTMTNGALAVSSGSLLTVGGTLSLTDSAATISEDATLDAGAITIDNSTMAAIQGSIVNATTLTMIEGATATIGATAEGTFLNDTDDTITIATVKGEVVLEDTSSLTIMDGATLTTGSTSMSDSSTLTVEDGGTYITGSTSMSGSTLTVADGGSYTTDSLTTSASSTVSGTVNLTAGGEATLVGKGLSDMALVATDGSTITVAATSNTSLGSLTVDNATITLGATGLVLTDASSITNSTVGVTINESDITSGDAITLFVSSDSVTLSNSTITLTYDGTSIDSLIGMEVVIADDVNLTNVELDLVGENLNGYVYLSSNGDGSYNIVFNTDVYGELGLTENGEAGLALATNAVSKGADESGDLGNVLKALNEYAADGNSRAGDTLGAALAGATTTSLGSAAMSDVSRQLGTIRNRTRAMGVNPTVVNENMPYYNAWVSAEGGSSELDADGTAAGHTLDSVGGSVGVDIDINDMLSIGFAYSYLVGDLSSDGADTAEGDLDSMYGSVYARINSKRWTHSIVATFGSIDASLDRTVNISDTYGSYKTKGETDGTAFGLMYEVGYTYAMNKDATTCIQPVFNISYVNSSISGYTESGSDAALTVGDQDNNYVTFGLGAVIETVVGENVYNRASVMSTRLMLKADAGDRESEADVSLVSNEGYSQTVKGADIGSVALEFGLGITIPVTEDVGAIFADVSCELRSGMTDVSGSVGYRFSF